MALYTVTGSTDRVIKSPTNPRRVNVTFVNPHQYIQIGGRWPRQIYMGVETELDVPEVDCLEHAGFTVTPVPPPAEEGG